MKRPVWYVRPGDEFLNPATGRPYPGNHAVPRIAWRLQHAHTATEQLVYAALEARGILLQGGKGRKTRKVSIAALGRELKMAESTVRDCLRSLRRKHSIVQWDAERGAAVPRKRGDFGGVTTWMIPSWKEGLEVRRMDPKIGTVNANCYVIGKGKRFLSDPELKAWKVDAVVAARLGTKAAARGTGENEMCDPPAEGAAPAVAKAATAATAEVASLATSPPAVAVGTDPEPKRIWEALAGTVKKRDFSHATAKALIKRARTFAAERGESLSDSEIEDAIYAAWENAHRNVMVIGFYDTALPEKLEALFERRARERDALAANDGKCLRCNGTGLVEVVTRGISHRERCICQTEEARAAG